MDSFGSYGGESGQFKSPYGIAIEEDQRFIYVSDLERQDVQSFGLSLQYQGLFGSSGSDIGEFDKPSGLAVLGDKVFVTEIDNNRLQVFDSP